MIWFSSDTHYCHKLLIEKRGFSSAEEMNSDITRKFNSVIQPNHTLYLLGDLALNVENNLQTIYDLRSGLNVGKIHFVIGNHDNIITKNKDRLLNDNIFNSIEHYNEVKFNKKTIIMSHYAFRIWRNSHYGSWHLYGHSHGSLADLSDSLSFDCGVDTNNMNPYSFEDVADKMSSKVWTQIDHHNRETT